MICILSQLLHMAYASDIALSATQCLLQKVAETIHRDAVAAVLGHIDAGAQQEALVVDVRRHDELALYGCIPGMTDQCY